MEPPHSALPFVLLGSHASFLLYGVILETEWNLRLWQYSKGFHSVGNFSIPACLQWFTDCDLWICSCTWLVVHFRKLLDGFPNYLGEVSLIVLDPLLGADNEVSGNVIGCKKSILHILLLKVSEYVYDCCHLSNPFSTFGLDFFLCSVGIGFLFHHACWFAALLQCWPSLNSIYSDFKHMEKLSAVIIFPNLQYLETICNIKVKLIWNFHCLILTDTATQQFCAPHECSCHLSSKTDHRACLQSLFHRCSAPKHTESDGHRSYKKDNSVFLGSSFHIWIMSCTKYTESEN